LRFGVRPDTLSVVSQSNRIDHGRAAELLSGWKRPVLISHAKPDGDAIGSLLAMRALLHARGIQATPLLFEPLPARYEGLAQGQSFAVGDATKAGNVLSFADAAVILDTCSYSQLEPVAEWLKKTTLPKLVIDHHSTRDAITQNLLIDETAAATCLIIYELAQSSGWTIDAAATSSLFVGISTDTGWFRHSNTDVRALHAAGNLLERGVKAYQVYETLYLNDSAGRVRLLSEALKTLQLHCSDQLAMMTLPSDAFSSAGATPADTEDIVNEPLRIASVVVSVLLVEQEDGVVRINFRSKAPEPKGQRPDVDVASIAKEFGGGGHRNAAGARSKEPLNSMQELILVRLESVLDR